MFRESDTREKSSRDDSETTESLTEVRMIHAFSGTHPGHHENHEEDPTHAPSSSLFPTPPEERDEIFITNIRATDVALGLRRLPVGFYAMLRHGDRVWRTENKPSSVNDDVVEWSGLIPIPSDTSTSICLEVYASFELQPMLGGEHLRELIVTVEQLLDRSTKRIPFTFSPKDGDVVSPCSAVFFIVERHNRDNRDSGPSASIIPLTFYSATAAQGEFEDATNHGHGALSRYRKHGEKRDLECSVAAFQRAFDTCPVDHPCRAAALSNLGMAKLMLCQLEDMGVSLEGPLRLFHDALAARPVDHADRPSTLIRMATVHLAQFKEQRDEVEGARAEALLREVIELTTTESHEHQASMFLLRLLVERQQEVDPVYKSSVELHSSSLSTESSLTSSLQSLRRFEKLGDFADLQQAITLLEKVVGTMSVWDAQYHIGVANLGVAFMFRYEHLGEPSDLKAATSRLSDAMGFIPDAHPDKPSFLNNLGKCFLTRFERHGDLSDLEAAISSLSGALGFTPDGHPDKAGRLNNLGSCFRARFARHGDLSDLEAAILTFTDAVGFTPDGHPDKARLLNNLGSCFLTRFARHGDLSDLEAAISSLTDAVGFTPHGHPDKAGPLNTLGACFLTRFECHGDLSDLEAAISSLGDAVGFTPDGHPYKGCCLSSLGTCFLARFDRHGDLSDLEAAISSLSDAVGFTPDGHPDKPGWLTNLGKCFLTRFERHGDLSDLEAAISTFTDAVDFTPDGHPDKARGRSNLGNCFLTRFKRHGGLSDLEAIILNLSNAVGFTPHAHSYKQISFRCIGNCFFARFERLKDPNDLNDAILFYSHAASAPFGPIQTRFSASEQWISCARLIHHPSLLRAYSVAISLLPRLAWAGLSLTRRYDELRQSVNIVREAAAVALDSGFPQLAVEWLEQGRSIVWGDLLQLRNPYQELLTAHPEHARRLQELSIALDGAVATCERSSSTLSELGRSQDATCRAVLQEEADQQRELAIERDKLLKEIRRLPGFERFLLHKDFSQLRALAHSGPIVILNAAKSRCDALIVLENVDHVIHVPLPHFTLEQAFNRQGYLKNFLRQAHVIRSERDGQSVPWDHSDWESFLAPLWKCIVEPVLDALAFSSPGDISRIFWCPTGPLTFLPLHAAGLYGTEFEGAGHKVFDFVVSSYIPTLSVLAPSHDLSTVSEDDDLRLLAVRQPSSDGQGQLPGVAPEMKHISEAINGAPLARTTILEPSNGTVKEVLDLMKKADWIHFACHGIQDTANPTKSGLCLADRRRLQVSDIVALSRPRRGLAFLSACQTAAGDEVLSDEAVHIAAGMLFAGYGGVIGTMWSISDIIAPDVARDVYGHLFRKWTRPDYRDAAFALHEAVRCLREDDVSFSNWVPFIHVGL